MKSNLIQRAFLPLFALCLVLVLSACNKEEIEQPTDSQPWYMERVVDVTHTYRYYGEEFTVIYTYDQEDNRILGTSGDVERAKAMFGEEESAPKGFIFDVSFISSDAVLSVDVYDTEAEALAQRPKPPVNTETNAKSCQYFESAGSATYQFFEHANYAGELTDLTKHNKAWLGWNYVMDHNNDKISSVRVTGNAVTNPTLLGNLPWLEIYEDWCYGGHVLLMRALHSPTTLQFPNLAHFQLYWYWWSGSVSANDQASSLRGYWWY